MKTKLRYLYRAYRYRYHVDAAELRFVRASLRPGDVAVDIGCHKGAYTYWMRRRVGPTGHVFAFEPQPKQIAYLRTAFAALPFENVVLVPMGVSDTVGRGQLYTPTGTGQTHAATLERAARSEEREAGSGEGGARNGRGHENMPRSAFLEVDITTLDAFFAERACGPDFLKIDVEGHELAVLHGARHTLEMHQPTLLVECEARHRSDGSVRPVFDFLRSFGYEGTFFHGGTRRPLAEFNPAVHQRVEIGSDRLPRGYVNNFAFIPSV